MPVKINTKYLLYRNIFFISGAVIGVFLCILMVFTLGLRKRNGLLIFAIAAVIIIGGICSNNSLEMLGNIVSIETLHLKSYSHFILFFILGAVSIHQLYARLSIRAADSLFPPYSFPVFAGLVLFACLTESLQFFTFDRTPNFIDLLIDTTGIGTGIVLVCFVKKQLRK